MPFKTQEEARQKIGDRCALPNTQGGRRKKMAVAAPFKTHKRVPSENGRQLRPSKRTKRPSSQECMCMRQLSNMKPISETDPSTHENKCPPCKNENQKIWTCPPSLAKSGILDQVDSNRRRPPVRHTQEKARRQRPGQEGEDGEQNQEDEDRYQPVQQILVLWWCLCCRICRVCNPTNPASYCSR